MPVHPVKGRPGCYQWGDSGKVYCGDGAKEKAEAQQRAAYANGYRGKAEMMMPASDEYQYGDDRWWLYLTWEIKDKDTLMAYRDEGRFQIWILLQPYHYNRGKQYGGKITFICTAKYADAKEECEQWIARNLPHTKGEPQYIRRSMNKDVRDKGKYYSVEFLGLTYNEEAYGRKRLDGYYAAEEDKKNFTTIEDIEVGDVFKFGDGWERFVLKSKEIDGYEFDDEDGEIILYKIVFDPYKPSPVSDINGLVKSNVKMVRWNNPYLRMAKRRAGIKEAEELGLDEFRDGLYNLFIKGKITEEQFIAWGNDYEAYLEGDKTEKPPFAAEEFDKEISFIERKYTKEQLRDLLNANYHKRTFPDKIWGTKTYEYGIDDKLLKQTPLRKLSMAYSYEMGKRNHWLKGKKKYVKTEGLAEWRWVQKRKDGRIISNPKMRLGAESNKKPYSVEISRSSNPEKKLMAVFSDKEGNKIKTTHFGQRGASDYTKHGDKERMERYLERHGGGTTTSTKEDWKDPTTAGALSRWILWNKPSLSGSFSDFKRRFGLKGSMKVSKSAEGKLSSAQKSLNKWTKEDWGTKSGKPSTQGDEATGERYLPRKAREALTDKEYARTSAKKRRDTAKGKQFSPQPDDVEEKVKKYRTEQPLPNRDIVMNFYEEILYDEDSDLFKMHQELNPPNQKPKFSRALAYNLFIYSFWKDEVPKNNRNGTPKTAKDLIRDANKLQRENPKKLPIKDLSSFIWTLSDASQKYRIQGSLKKRFNEVKTPWLSYKNKIYYWEDTDTISSLNNDFVKEKFLSLPTKQKMAILNKNWERYRDYRFSKEELEELTAGAIFKEMKLKGFDFYVPRNDSLNKDKMIDIYEKRIEKYAEQVFEARMKNSEKLLTNAIEKMDKENGWIDFQFVGNQMNLSEYKVKKAIREIKEKYMIEGTYGQEYDDFWIRYDNRPYYIRWMSVMPSLHSLNSSLGKEMFRRIKKHSPKEKRKNLQRNIFFEAIEGKGSKARFTDQPDPKIYRDPALRQKARNSLLKGTKGGDAGEWSARKAQMAATKYRTMYENKYGEGKNPYFAEEEKPLALRDKVELKDVIKRDLPNGSEQVNLFYMVLGSKGDAYRYTIQNATSKRPIHQCTCKGWQFGRKRAAKGLPRCKHEKMVKTVQMITDKSPEERKQLLRSIGNGDDEYAQSLGFESRRQAILDVGSFMS